MAQKVTAMDIRAATALAGQVVNVSQFCREHQISRQTFYKYRRRFAQLGLAGFQEQSRRPVSSPGQTAAAVEEAVLRKRMHSGRPVTTQDARAPTAPSLPAPQRNPRRRLRIHCHSTATR